MAKDPKPENGRAGGPSRGGSGSSKATGQRAGGQRAGGQVGRGRTRPPANVVAQQKPWGLIAAAVVVVLFAAGVISYAVVKVNQANADKVTALDQISGIASYDYASGQEHVTTPVTYTESPPVGGPHDPEWADCTGTVYSADIRHENAVHALEHGATWITYDPDTISDADLTTLQELVEGRAGLMLSPYAGLTSTISLQSWNHQLSLDSASDERVEQFVDFLTLNSTVEGHYPEVGASCENPTFITDPLVEGDSSRGDSSTATDAPTTETPAAGASSSTGAATETSTTP